VQKGKHPTFFLKVVKKKLTISVTGLKINKRINEIAKSRDRKGKGNYLK
jgi:hypothetical protein